MCMATKKRINEIKKAAKKNPKGAIIVVTILLVIAVVAAIICFVTRKPESTFELKGAKATSLEINERYEEPGFEAFYKGTDVSDQVTFVIHKDSLSGITVAEIDSSTESIYYIVYSIEYEEWSASDTRLVCVGTAPIEINFMELGNHNTGDSTYIKAGDTDILIDAGSTGGSADTICSYMESHGLEDNKIEYLVVTHAHKDHIAALVGTSKIKGVLDRYSIENIIQFSNISSETNLYKDYKGKVEKLETSGTKVYNAGEICDNKQNEFVVAPGTVMTVLDQKFYHEVSNDENNHSVCTLFKHGQLNYLFTGDLEKEGENSLVELNPNLPKVQLFKGGHHGSKTSNNESLLSVIKPEVVCICCCAGNDEYTKNVDNQFPTQAAIDRISKYTDSVYVTTVTTDGHSGFTSMNGNIVFKSLVGIDYDVIGSNNSTKLKDTDWFKSNRTTPSYWA